MSINKKGHLITPQGRQIYFSGPPLQEGPTPSVIYFALSAEMSLFTDPFNQPVVAWNNSGIRVFSWDLPFHGHHLDPHAAMHEWAKEFAANPQFISGFIDECCENLNFLHNKGLIDFTQIGVSGLSRGGFMATHLAARDSRLCYVLGFAPLTKPRPLEEFKDFPSLHLEEVALSQLVDKLVRVQIRFYIGNNDVRVGTDDCYTFIRELTNQAIHNGIRSPQTELIIYPSIGFRGHGTPPNIFLDGAAWLKTRLIP